MPHKTIQPAISVPNLHRKMLSWGIALFLHGLFFSLTLTMTLSERSSKPIEFISLNLVETRSNPSPKLSSLPPPRKPIKPQKKQINQNTEVINNNRAKLAEKIETKTSADHRKPVEPITVYKKSSTTNPVIETIDSTSISDFAINSNPIPEPKNNHGIWQLKTGTSEEHLKPGVIKTLRQKASCERSIKQMDLSINRAVKPCHRPGFKVPEEGFLKSGYCRVKYDINLKGRPENIDVLQCTNEKLRNASIKAVKGWYYFPKVHSGKTEYHYDRVTKLTLQVSDQHGNLLNADLLIDQ